MEEPITSYFELLIPSPLLLSANMELIDLPGYNNADDSDIKERILQQLSTLSDLDVIIGLTATPRKVSSSFFLHFYNCGLFKSTPFKTPKLMYLVNRTGLETTKDYAVDSNLRVENCQAIARHELIRALDDFVDMPEFSNSGIDPDVILMLKRRCAAVPFFSKPHRGFDTVHHLKKCLLEVQYHHLVGNVLEGIKDLTNHIILVKPSVIANQKADVNKIYAQVATFKDKHKTRCDSVLAFAKGPKLFATLYPKQAIRKMNIDEALRQPHDVRLQEIKDLIYTYFSELELECSTIKSALIENLLQSIQSMKVESQVEELFEDSLKTAKLQISVAGPLPVIPLDLINAVNERNPNTIKVTRLLRSFIDQAFKNIVEDLKNYYPIPIENITDVEMPIKEKETLQKELIKYENLLRTLHARYDFNFVVNSRLRKVSGISKAVVRRHEAPKNDKAANQTVNIPEDSEDKELDYIDITPKTSSSSPSSDTQVLVSFDLSTEKISFDISALTQEDITKMKTHSTDEKEIYPVFVPSKLRGKESADSEDKLEVLPPQLYSSEFEIDFPGTVVIPVVDKTEAKAYWDFITKTHPAIKFMLVIDDAKLRINIGRKRHIIKIFAEKVSIPEEQKDLF